MQPKWITIPMRALSMVLKRSTLLGVTAACIVLAGMAPAQAQSKKQGNPNPGVLPPHSKSHGKSYGEWGAEWWNWAFSSPIAINPLTDTTGEFCHTNQSGPVWFLAGFLDITGFEEPVVRECTIPPGKALFFPIINSVWAATEEDETEEEMRAGANADIDAVTVVEASINGVPVVDPWRYRAESPAFVLELPEGAILDDLLGLSGELYPSVTDGYWLMLAPLPVGQHTIHFRGVSGDPEDPDFEVEVLYLLTVSPPGRR